MWQVGIWSSDSVKIIKNNNNFKSKFATNDLEKVVIGFSGRIHSIKYTFDRYDEYQNDVNSRNLLKLASRFAALIVVAAGAVVTAIASIVSGVLSIERNTRQEDIK